MRTGTGTKTIIGTGTRTGAGPVAFITITTFVALSQGDMQHTKILHFTTIILLPCMNNQ
jgi:hypothetical protein